MPKGTTFFWIVKVLGAKIYYFSEFFLPLPLQNIIFKKDKK